MFADNGADDNGLLCGPKFAITSLSMLDSPAHTPISRQFRIANFDSLFCEARRARWPKGKSSGRTYHVVPNSEGEWDVHRGDSSLSSGHFDTKQDAADRGRQISRNANSEVKIHNRYGRIGQSDSHSNDPRNIKG